MPLLVLFEGLKDSESLASVSLWLDSNPESGALRLNELCGTLLEGSETSAPSRIHQLVPLIYEIDLLPVYSACWWKVCWEISLSISVLFSKRCAGDGSCEVGDLAPALSSNALFLPFVLLLGCSLMRRAKLSIANNTAVNVHIGKRATYIFYLAYVIDNIAPMLIQCETSCTADW